MTRIQLWFQIVIFLLIFSITLFVTKADLNDLVGVALKIPISISIYILLYMVFVRWLWRFKIFQGWLVQVPCIQGTWEGVLKTTWTNSDTGNRPAEIKAYLVIKQTLVSLKCIMYTKESTSNSVTASLVKNEGSGVIQLNYNYNNVPRVEFRERSEPHKGAATLTVITKPDLKLDGEYWTNRTKGQAVGDIVFKFKSREIIQDFPSE